MIPIVAQPTQHATRNTEDAKSRAQAAKVLRRITHQTIKKVTDDLELYEFNTIIAALMTMTNALVKQREALEGTPEWSEAVNTLLLLMAPVSPHIAEELWA